MKFLINTFPNMEFEPEKEGFTKMKEPALEKLMLLALPLGFAVAFLLYLMAQILTQTHLDMISLSSFGLHWALFLLVFTVGFLLFNVMLIVFHEGVHALCFPEGIRSEHVGFGFHKSGAFFAYYTEALPRWRMIFSMFVPFFLFSIVPLLVIIVLDKNIPLLMMAVLYHTLLAAGDLAGIILVLKNTPRGSVLKNKGYYTYYK